MTQYLKVTVGNGQYLLASAQVLEVRPAAPAAEPALPIVDCRRLFAAAAAAPGWHVVLSPGDGRMAVLVVDRFDGLVALDDGDLRALPPIGRHGHLIDAVSVPSQGERPALRLRIEPALFADI